MSLGLAPDGNRDRLDHAQIARSQGTARSRSASSDADGMCRDSRMISTEARGTRCDYGCRYGPTRIQRPEPAAMQGVFEAEPEDSIAVFRERSSIFASRLSRKRSLGGVLRTRP